MPTKVLVVVQSFGIGGTERAAVTYASLYKKLCCEVFVYGIYGGGPLQARLQDLGIISYAGFQSIKALVGAATFKAFDLIHVNAGGPYDPVVDTILSLLKSSNTRVVQTNVFARSDYGPKSNLVDLELLISEAGFWKWSTHSRNSPRQRPAALLPYLVEEARFHVPLPKQQTLAREALGIPSDAVVFGRVGQPGMNKWDARIITTCLYIQQAMNSSYFLFLGCPPSLKTAFLRQKVLQKRILFLPATSDDVNIQEAYAAMDVFLHLSRIGESFGLVLVEAAQAGLPIATLATPLKDDAQGEVITRMHAGNEAWNPRQLARLAIELASKKRQNARLAIEISSAATHFYGATQSAKGFQEFLDEVLHRRAEELRGRVFCLPSEDGRERQRLGPADDMRLKRQKEVLACAGLFHWLAFRALYTPIFYRLYRAMQEKKYVRGQMARAAELKKHLVAS